MLEGISYSPIEKKKILLDNIKTKVLKVKQQCQGKFENWFIILYFFKKIEIIPFFYSDLKKIVKNHKLIFGMT